MTVYTVIGYITHAILTFEPLPIPSNLSGGPQLKIKKDQTTGSRKGYCMWHGIQKTTKRERQKEYGEILDVSGGIG